MRVRDTLESRWRHGLVLLTLVLLVSSLGGVAVGSWIAVAIVVVLLGAAIILLLKPRTETSEGETHDVWDAIPSWQYAGRHVESGGLARDEQERAVAEVQQQAEEQVTEQPPR